MNQSNIYKTRMAQIAFALVLFSLGVLIVLTIFIRHHSVLNVDVYLSRDLQKEGDTILEHNALFYFFSFVSFWGRTIVAAAMVSVVGIIFWLFRCYRESVFIILTPLSSAIDWLVKLLVNRPRPSDSLVNVIDRQMSASFPSGHVVFYTVFFGLLIAIMFRRHQIALWLRIVVILISLFFIAAISFSRIYLGAHWASDVAGGYLLGLACLISLVYFYLRDNRSK